MTGGRVQLPEEVPTECRRCPGCPNCEEQCSVCGTELVWGSCPNCNW